MKTPNLTVTFNTVNIDGSNFELSGLSVNITRSQLSQMMVSYDGSVEFEQKLDVFFYNSSIVSLLANPVNLFVSDVDIRNMYNLSAAIFTLQNSNVHVLNSIFVNNHARKELSDEVFVVIGTVVSQVLIQDSTFIESSAVAVFDRSHVEILDSSFTKNVANGLIIALTSNISINNSMFSENKGNKGGAIYIQRGTDLRVYNSSFISNKANTSGPAIIGNLHSIVHLFNCQFVSNEASNKGAVFLYVNSLLYVESCNFTKNKAQFGSCIVIGNNTSADVITSYFKFNQAVQGGAIIVGDNSTLNLTDNVFSNNRVSGEISNLKGNFLLGRRNQSKENQFKVRSQAKKVKEQYDYQRFLASQPLGGAVTAVRNVKLIIKNSIFNGHDGGESGGVLCLITNVKLEVFSSKFIENKAVIGAVMSAIGPVNIAIDDSEFSHNRASSTGGVLDMTNTACYMHNSKKYYWHNNTIY